MFTYGIILIGKLKEFWVLRLKNKLINVVVVFGKLFS